MIEVVIPAYNAAPFLHETLASVAAQTRRPDLVSVVDDASTDATRAIAEAAAQEFAARIRIQILRNEGPRGPSAARNTAIRRSTADFIALLDADDLMQPNHLALLAAALEAAPDAVLSFGDTEVFAADKILIPGLLQKSGVLALPAIAGPDGYWQLRDGIFAPLLASGVFGTSACLFRRQAAGDAGLFDEAMMHGEDTDLFIRLALAGRFLFTRTQISRKREHADNLSHDRNRLAFCHGTARSLMKLSAPAWLAKLSPAQRVTLASAARFAVDSYLYHASRAGMTAYRRAASLARQAGFGRLAAHPRHLLRLGVHALR
jgi:glycosyltransferase involved in cell wall biosynthesis